MQTIMLIDMDYFFVACEELRRPEIRVRPVAVGFDPKEGRGRGVIMTCNYAARRFGLRSGMPISMAYRLKPDALFLPLDYDYYEKKSAEVMRVIKGFAEKFEQVSVDEAFIDVSGRVAGYDDAIGYAQRVKAAIKAQTGLPCSVGIGSNKLLAKMACEAGKPDGVRLLRDGEVAAFLEKLPVDKLHGIGHRTREKLEAMGYKTVGELARANTMDLMDKLGSYGIEIQKYANGIDESRVEENYQVKSIGRERTFEHDTRSREEVVSAIRELSREVAGEVNSSGVSFRVVTLKMRYYDFTEHLKSRSIRPTGSVEDLAHTAADLYLRHVDPEKDMRKVGVRVSGLAKQRGQRKMQDFAK